MNDFENINGQSGPFGDADASRVVDFETLRNAYVDLSNSSGLRERLGADVSVRFIFGKKGSGKTLYLRTIQNYYRKIDWEKPNSVYITEIDNNPTDTHLIVKVTEWFGSNGEKDEVWRRIWKLVILNTVRSHLLFTNLAKKLKTSIKKRLTELEICNYQHKSATSLFNELTSFLGQFNSGEDLRRRIYDQKWVELENTINEALRTSPPLYFFLDQLDDDLQKAPYHWIKCQYGLFSAIMRFIRSGGNWGRLHILVCFREVVYAYVLQTPEGTKILSDSKIKVLKWNKKLLRFFLEKKIEKLDNKYFSAQSKSKTVESFFGVNYINVKRKNKQSKEDIREYIIRHTMLLPRHIILVGNIFSQNRDDFQTQEELHDFLKKTVRVVARKIAEEQLKLASIFICNGWMYDGAADDGNLEVLSDEKILKQVDSRLRKFIKKINQDRITHRTLERYEKEKGKYSFAETDDPFNALFHAGLLGYVDKNSDGEERTVFFSESKEGQYELPFQGKYVFHSCLIDLLGIKPQGEAVNAYY